MKARLSAALLLCGLLVFTGYASDGDSKAAQGAGTGAALGAGLGLLIGALGGKPEEGLLVGAALGAGQGAYEGWRQDQDDARTAQITTAIRESAGDSRPADAEARTREELTRFLGTWDVEGWIEPAFEKRLAVSGRANGHVEMNYFVELGYIDLSVEGHAGPQIWGSSTFGYDLSSGFAISTRFNTLPEPIRLTGTFDAPSRTFTFEHADGVVAIRFDTPDRFYLETTTGSRTVESFSFTRT